MVDIVVRHFEHSDLPAMLETRRTSIRRICAHDYDHDQIMAWAPDIDDVEAQATRFAKTQTWVALVNGNAAGFMNLAEGGYVDCLYVHADHQRCGIASALLSMLEKTARAQGVSRLYSEVSITARPFFERQGFAVTTPQTVTVNGQQYLNFRMEKMLR